MRNFIFFLRKHPAGILMTILATVIIALFGWDVIGTSNPTASADTEPRVVCTQGKTVVMRWEERFTLEAKERHGIVKWDIVKTLPNSQATIFWTNGSITRLSEKTSITIGETPTEERSTVDFSLNSGKSYSRLFRYLRDDEYFNERYDNGEKIAAVRGTAFEIDTEKSYIHTTDHAVEIFDRSGKSLWVVAAWVVASLSDISKRLGSEVLDATWEKFNENEDVKDLQERLVSLKTRYDTTSQTLLAKIKNIFATNPTEGITVSISTGGLSLDISAQARERLKSPEYRAAVLSNLENIYRDTASLPSDTVSVNSKEQLRSLIIANADSEEKPKLSDEFARHTLYDLSEAMKRNSPSEVRTMAEAIKSYQTSEKSTEWMKRFSEALPVGDIQKFNENAKKWDIDPPFLYSSWAVEAARKALDGLSEKSDELKWQLRDTISKLRNQ